jgi:hypothetical protein
MLRGPGISTFAISGLTPAGKWAETPGVTKRWFPYACLALMLVAEIFLFRANHERDSARADLRDARQQLHDLQDKLDALESSSAGAQAQELASLRKQNDALTTKVSVLQNNLTQLQMQSQQTAEHLTTARTALELQQAHLQQLQAEQQSAAAAANAAACINNLRLINAAKQQWALDKQAGPNDVPSMQDLQPYFKDGFPACPDGGVYSINSASQLPTCSVPGHVLPQ